MSGFVDGRAVMLVRGFEIGVEVPELDFGSRVDPELLQVVHGLCPFNGVGGVGWAECDEDGTGITRTGLINRLYQLPNFVGPALLLGPILARRGSLLFMRPVVRFYGAGMDLPIPLRRGWARADARRAGPAGF